MVKICPTNYPKQREEKYIQHFEKYPFPLSNFQKYAVEAIVEGHHVLVTAHTGSGKTLPGEFAIEYFVAQGKKVIYTSPIKALSNQKFYEFKQKYPHISFGILTGDIKSNPEADVLIMTTEILQNTLYRKNTVSTGEPSSLLQFDMNIETELSCVIFDEVHYINDQERGKVWEETIMMLPPQVQMVMLSATLDQPEKFALWCENRHIGEKKVYLSTTYERVVPLIHYSFITATTAVFKVIKDKSIQGDIKRATNELFVLQNERGEFNEQNYLQMKKTLEIMNKKEIRIKRSHSINQALKYLVEKEMLPAVCFVFSRKLLETYASEITTNLLEFDSKIPYTIRRECEQIIRKLPNFNEYLELPEYQNMVALLEKGIAIHHAGVMPILREMVELLYSKGCIKLIFCTETFAVGINMPTKTVLFTDITKFDGTNERILYPHEYTQMAGRAGRRGMDTIGHVIHLNNIFRPIDQVSYKNMLKGKPQTLVSKFKISYNLLLNLMDTGHTDFAAFASKSMIQETVDSQAQELFKRICELTLNLQKKEAGLEHLRTPTHILDEFIELKNPRLNISSNKKRKENNIRLEKLKDQFKYILSDEIIYLNFIETNKELINATEHLKYIENEIGRNVNMILQVLKDKDFIIPQEPGFCLSLKGKIAVNLREVHCLVFAGLIYFLKDVTPVQLISIFSCFTNITVAEDFKSNFPETEDEPVKKIIQIIQQNYGCYQNIETDKSLDTGVDYHIHFDLIGYVEKWAMCENVEECKYLLQTIAKEKAIFLGEFVKALLKINNISGEMEKIAEMLGDVEFLSRLRKIPGLTLKYVATNQSLYI